MTKEELLEYIDSWENLPYLLNEITKTPEFYLMLIEIALYNCNQKSWRAAYLIDKINDNYPQLLQPFLNEMIDQVKIEKSHSKKRHFLKLIGQNELPPEQQGFMLDFCIKTFTSAKEDLAVRVHAMQILYNISEKEPELKPEILVLIEYEMENHSSAGIVSRGRKLAQNLRNQIG
jgi:hypothetical protein